MRSAIFIILLFAFVECHKSPNGDEYFSSLTKEEIDLIPKEIAEDAQLDVMGLIRKYGYPAESHEVQTEDGYLLTLHRIPSDTRFESDTERTPVFLMHGLLSSSADWIINGPGKALAYILADNGFDVWMGNARGNFYSRKHTTLDPEKSKFWSFSWNEIGQIDLPTMIDHVLNVTGRDKLHYVGHSQGTTSFFVMCSSRRGYNDKILTMQGLAPVAYISNGQSPVFKYLAQYANSIKILLSLIGINEILPKSNLTAALGHTICTEESQYLPICTNILFQLVGHSPEQLNITMLPIYVSHTPAGASSRQLVHYAQMFVSEKFRQYDHGFILNMNKYKALSPPNYKLKYVKAPVALHYSDNDLLADPLDVFKLQSELPNVLGLFRVPDDKFNHLDFIWGIDAKPLLYDQVITLMKDNNNL